MFDWSDSKTWSKGEGFLGRRQRRRMFEWLLIRRHNRYAPLLLLLPSRPLASQLASWINIYILSPIQPCLLLASPAPLEASAPKLALILIYTHTHTYTRSTVPPTGRKWICPRNGNVLRKEKSWHFSFCLVSFLCVPSFCYSGCCCSRFCALCECVCHLELFIEAVTTQAFLLQEEMRGGGGGGPIRTS